ncbi:liver carboxylesterase 1F-like [Dreissena polymorpha]|uniref:Carboxylic ester hydrolase n=1 Tax=Dreissena polymorpha TaxID=45954 RepID=A0A9D4K1L7_DREPO|nr:liver carboxylesterase 1F-like [Dreissena polymorpha]KAH3828213.1 hypothetical protein DPMN_130165 [Dreissena polymorpha]
MLFVMATSTLSRCIIFMSFLAVGSCKTTSVLQTTSGPMQGSIHSYNGSDVYQFIGIPYAAPPVRELRFMKPVPPTAWNSTFTAERFPPSCMQYLFENDRWLIPKESQNISEDCLYMNIYVPRATSSAEPKAVMIWIHGGGFTAGQGSIFDASYIALRGDVIVVTFNYRLGLFGFLSTEDTNARGNYGIWDQVAAIKWVSENIANFGGDNSKVCIFGESAGGNSVGLHTIIQENRGRIHRAISESGAVYSPRAVAEQSQTVARRAAEMLNCSTRSTKDIVECLRTVPAGDLLKVQGAASALSNQSGESFVNHMGPVVDGDLIIDHPVEILKNRSSEGFKFFQTLDILAGTNIAEGGLMYWPLMKYQHQYHYNISEGVPAGVLCDVVATAAAEEYAVSTRGLIKDAVCKQYTVRDGSLAEQGRSTVDVYADLQFFIPTVQTLDAHYTPEKVGRSFQYIFTHQPSFTWIRERPPWLIGANHAGELPFVFGLDAMYPPTHEKPRAERKLSESIMTYWTNFAKTGTPNGDPSLPIWPDYEPTTSAYMNLSLDLGSGVHLFSDRVHFWTRVVPDITSTVIEGQTDCACTIALGLFVSIYVAFATGFVMWL